MSKLGIIAGTGFDELKSGAGESVFINRHGPRYCPPHEIDARRNILQLQNSGVDKIVAIAAVGSLNPRMRPGDFVLLSDFIDFTRARQEFFDPRKYTDLSFPYDEGLRQAIRKAAAKLKIKLHPTAIYVCVEGPRFETKAEIRMFRQLGGDVVGMTQVPEVVLAAEAGIPYAAIGVVTNFAAGISRQRISSDEVVAIMRQKQAALSRLISALSF